MAMEGTKCFVCGERSADKESRFPKDGVTDYICEECGDFIKSEAGLLTGLAFLPKEDCSAIERVGKLEAMLWRFVSYFGSTENRRESLGTMIQDAKTLLAKRTVRHGGNDCDSST